MRKFLLLSTLVVTLTFVTSCSKDNNFDVGQNNQVEIKIGGTALDVIPNTRAPFEGITTSNKLTAKVMAANTSSKYTTSLLHDNFMDFGLTDAVGFTSPKAYPDASSSVFLVGMYPSTTWTVTGDVNAVYKFSGIEDVMASDEVETQKDDVVLGPHKSLTFHHLLTKLNLTVQAKDLAAQTAWGKVTSLQVVSPNNVVTVTLGTGSNANPPAALFSTDGIQNFNFYKLETDNLFCSTGSPEELPLAANSPSTQSYALVAPQENSSVTDPIKYTIKIKTEKYSSADRSIDVPLTVNTGGAYYVGKTAGLMFDVVLTFTTTNIEAKATVKPWVPGGNGDVEVD